MDEKVLIKKLEGIAEVRDETDRMDYELSLNLKKKSDHMVFLNYLLKNTDLQITYNFNMVAIHNRRNNEDLYRLLKDAYIEHQKEVVTRPYKFDFKKATERLHIVEGSNESCYLF